MITSGFLQQKSPEERQQFIAAFRAADSRTLRVAEAMKEEHHYAYLMAGTKEDRDAIHQEHVKDKITNFNATVAFGGMSAATSFVVAASASPFNMSATVTAAAAAGTLATSVGVMHASRDYLASQYVNVRNRLIAAKDKRVHSSMAQMLKARVNEWLHQIGSKTTINGLDPQLTQKAIRKTLATMQQEYAEGKPAGKMEVLLASQRSLAEQDVFIAVHHAVMIAIAANELKADGQETQMAIDDTLDQINTRLDTFKSIAPDRFDMIQNRVNRELATVGLQLPEISGEELRLANDRNLKM